MKLATLLILAFALIACAAWRRKIKHIQFVERFQPTEKFIGQDMSFAVAIAGPCTFFGSMDFGEDVAQWRRCGRVAELWLKQGRCTSVELH